MLSHRLQQVECATRVHGQRQMRIDARIGGADSGQVKDHLWHGLSHGGTYGSSVAQVKGQPVHLYGQPGNTLGLLIKGHPRKDLRSYFHQPPHQMLPNEASSSSDEGPLPCPIHRLAKFQFYWFRNS